ncbi:MAG TPA: hypothetical protein PK830_06710 [Candidatus Atribacteria bacterium]|nr:hypothetical protein [Candidatus Atribacteria bacterium]HPT78777.1 hypothetical protein [Candidatus Atribacteria bacterium]
MKKIIAACLILACCAVPFTAKAGSDAGEIGSVDRLVSEISRKTK